MLNTEVGLVAQVATLEARAAPPKQDETGLTAEITYVRKLSLLAYFGRFAASS